MDSIEIVLLIFMVLLIVAMSAILIYVTVKDMKKNKNPHVHTKNSIDINLVDLNLEDFNGCEFSFGEGKDFTCRVRDGKVYFEQYGEGMLHLDNINSVFKYNLLKKLLTE